jgi:hypothetical protein
LLAAGTDFMAVSGIMLSLSPSEPTSCVNITTQSDEAIEDLELFDVTVDSNDEAVNIVGGTITVAIEDQTLGMYVQSMCRAACWN